VKYEGLPGNKIDWITVVPVGTPELWWGEWHYAKPSENLANVEVPEYRDRRKRHPFAAASPPINTLASSLDPKTAGFGPSTDLWPNGARSIVGYFELMCPRKSHIQQQAQCQ